MLIWNEDEPQLSQKQAALFLELKAAKMYVGTVQEAITGWEFDFQVHKLVLQNGYPDCWIQQGFLLYLEIK